MKRKILIVYLIAISYLTVIAQPNSTDSTIFQTQQTSELSKHIFAPDIISSNDIYEFGSALSKDQKELYFGVRLNKDWKAEIRYSKYQNDKWSNPQKLSLDEKYTYNDPFLSEDENKLYFVSNMPINGVGEPKDFDIWYMQKTNNRWSKPINVGEIVNSKKDEFYVSISNNGSVYFVSNILTISEEDKWDFDIYYSQLLHGKYQKPIRLDSTVNSEHFECDPFIAPDESYLIFCSTKPGGFGEGDLYISFKDENNNWTKAINMGNIINTEFHEFCPQLTKDTKHLYYTSNGDIYWIDSTIMDVLNPNK